MVLLPGPGAGDGGPVPGEPGVLAGADPATDDELASPGPPTGTTAPPPGRHE
jgi:hypothetical protein